MNETLVKKLRLLSRTGMVHEAFTAEEADLILNGLGYPHRPSSAIRTLDKLVDESTNGFVHIGTHLADAILTYVRDLETNQ